MPGLRLTLEGVLKKPIVWFRDHSSSYYRCVYLGSELLLTEEDLIAIDPRLPTAIDYAIPRNTAVVAGGLVQKTVQTWYSQNTALWTEYKGKSYYMERIDAITKHSPSNRSFVFTATALLGKKIDGVQVLTGQEYKDSHERDYAWLERYFPNAVNKLLAGEELGLSAEQLARYVFENNNETKVNVTMPGDLSF